MKMTRQEASEIIEQYRMCSSGDCPTLECADCEYNHDPRKVEEAFLTAIDALESAQPEPCEDAVSREAVSEWLKQYGQDVLHGKYKFSLMYIWKNLMDLPSAQSYVPDNNVGDTISRQVVLNEIEEWISALNENAHHESASDGKLILNAIKHLPSAQPEIIRCRDCKYERDDIFDRGVWCEKHPSFAPPSDDWFCGSAERR